MKKVFMIMAMAVVCLSTAIAATNDHCHIASPHGTTYVSVLTIDGKAFYEVEHHCNPFVSTSQLGLRTNIADFSQLEFVSMEQETVKGSYQLNTAKTSSVAFEAVKAICTFRNPDGHTLQVEFRVGDNDVAFRYLLPKEGETGSVRVLEELTEFTFNDDPEHTYLKTYLTPQSHAMIGWKRTKPSYEEYYGVGKPVTAPSGYGHGYTFPCLFRLGGNGWVLVSETGVDSRYCGSRLSEYYPVQGNAQGCAGAGYKIEYPMMEENNRNGTVEPAIGLPGATPWRTITLGETLKPIVETTITWDVVEPLYETPNDYHYGKSTWSWIVWQDASMNMPDQKTYVDLASEMGFDYILVDAGWDKNLGYDGAEELVRYAASKNVDVFLWYSSSGWWNDIVQSPVDVMSNPIARKKDMRWMQKIGVKGIKIDFFGGDKQETIRLYEAILSDADDHGLMAIFHGCTLPRGWERMYPNYAGSEAVRASENLIFGQYECDQEAQAATLHPFIRNAVGCMEFGGCFFNERLDRSNSRGTVRRTTDAFQTAISVLYQNPIQNFAITPNNLTDAPKVCLDFLKEVPTVWDETRYVSGCPGESAVIARRNGSTWYVAAVNAIDKPLEISVKEVMTALAVSDAEISVIAGGNEPVRTRADRRTRLSVPKNDGLVVVIGMMGNKE